MNLIMIYKVIKITDFQNSKYVYDKVILIIQLLIHTYSLYFQNFHALVSFDKRPRSCT